MKYLKLLQQKAVYLYILTLIASAVLATFVDAGYTFYSVSLWAFATIPLFAFWLLIPNKNWKLVKTYNPALIALFTWALFVFIGYFVPPFSPFGFKDLILFFSMNFVILGSVTIPWGKVHLRCIFRCLCVVAFLFSLYGIYRYIYFPFDRVIGPFVANVGQTKQLFPNAFAFFLILIIPIQILYLFNQASSRQITVHKLYFYISSIVIFSAFFLAFSRSSLIALLVLSLVFIGVQLQNALKGKDFFRGKAIRALLVIFLVSFVSISFINLARSYQYEISDFEERLDLDASENTTSFFDRFDYQSAGMKLSLDYPIFGIGADNFRFFYPKYQKAPLLATNPHNFAIRIASETGIPSAIFAALFIIFVGYFYLKQQHNIEQKYYVGTLGFILLAGVIQNSMDHNVNFVLNITILGLFTALFISRLPVTKKKISKSWQVLTITAMTLFLMVISVVSIHEYSADTWVKKARIAQANKDFEKAAEYYEKAADAKWFKEDFQIQSANMYKIMYLDGELTKKGEGLWIEAAEKAIDFSPHSDRTWNAYGEALYELGYYEKAKEIFEKALSIDPHNHLEYYHNLMLSKWHIGVLNQDDVDDLKERLLLYSELLENNPYLLTNSDNHLHAEDMYTSLIKEIAPNDNEIRLMYDEFRSIFEEQKESVPEIVDEENGGQERT
ncbi:O-antigen ligase family protein [Patescibacteria group bacterium]